MPGFPEREAFPEEQEVKGTLHSNVRRQREGESLGLSTRGYYFPLYTIKEVLESIFNLNQRFSQRSDF